MKLDWTIINIIHAEQSIDSFLESMSYLLVGTLLLSLKETSVSCSVHIQEQELWGKKRDHAGRAGMHTD